jgi:hypothetical protein
MRERLSCCGSIRAPVRVAERLKAKDSVIESKSLKVRTSRYSAAALMTSQQIKNSRMMSRFLIRCCVIPSGRSVSPTGDAAPRKTELPSGLRMSSARTGVSPTPSLRRMRVRIRSRSRIWWASFVTNSLLDGVRSVGGQALVWPPSTFSLTWFDA